LRVGMTIEIFIAMPNQWFVGKYHDPPKSPLRRGTLN
jgi:hypothetical protein